MPSNIRAEIWFQATRIAQQTKKFCQKKKNICIYGICLTLPSGYICYHMKISEMKSIICSSKNAPTCRTYNIYIVHEQKLWWMPQKNKRYIPVSKNWNVNVHVLSQHMFNDKYIWNSSWSLWNLLHICICFVTKVTVKRDLLYYQNPLQYTVNIKYTTANTVCKWTSIHHFCMLHVWFVSWYNQEISKLHGFWRFVRNFNFSHITSNFQKAN